MEKECSSIFFPRYREDGACPGPRWTTSNRVVVPPTTRGWCPPWSRSLLQVAPQARSRCTTTKLLRRHAPPSKWSHGRSLWCLFEWRTRTMYKFDVSLHNQHRISSTPTPSWFKLCHMTKRNNPNTPLLEL
jgi:hypothetical protein